MATGLSPKIRLDSAHQMSLPSSIHRARTCLLDQQHSDGHWCAELQGDTILESEFILLMAFLGREDEERTRKAARYIVTQQRPDGAWSTYPGGPVDVSVSVKAYFALKLTGHDADADTMRRARRLIREHGGAECCNSFTKFYLALLGQIPYANCASVPPEMMFLPKSAYFNLHAMSSWTRTIVVPLTIFSAHKPVRRLPANLGIRELFLENPKAQLWPHPPTKRLLTAENIFLGLDWLVKLYEKYGPKRWRRQAIGKAAQWMIDHFQDSDGVGAIFPPIIYTIVALRCLGYPDDSAEMRYAVEQLDNLVIEEDDTVRLQPCFSPVWDTALSLNALAVSQSMTSDVIEAMSNAAKWLLDREVQRYGDWSVMNRKLPPGGWFFEYRNGFYPDTDDTAMVLMGLARSGHAWDEDGDKIEPVQRGLRWLMAMQNDDGGWAAFDRNINHELLTKVPFADHNAMLDPSCPDITARVLESLGEYGFRPGMAQVDRALAFIAKKQDPRGCWIGRWGVNYIYGSWQVLIGLQSIGYDMDQPMVRRCVRWLKQVQQPCGGWGESCATYEDPSLAGQGTPTASQTAWALLGLIAAGQAESDTVRHGIQYLLRTQQESGDWQEDEFTGTGFPKVFYLKYHLYSLYFPLMALARYQQAVEQQPTHAPHEVAVPRRALAA